MQFPHAGQTFQGKYKLLEVLGRGGFAAVYRAIDIEIGREVAIKVLVPTDGGYESGMVARFMREARVVAQLRDPHTITMFDFGRSDDGLLFMVFEYVAGADLAHVIVERGPLRPEHAIHVVLQLLQALREAHTAGVLHRDIKPANVLVYSYMGDDWRVKLLDFGIAKPGVGKNADPVATLTKAGGIIGTPRYMSPEQLCGEELDATTDIYSLGLVTYEMLIGAPAIDGRDTRDNLRLQLSENPLTFPPGNQVPPQLRAFVERMMAREPSERFQSARQAYESLNALERNNQQEFRAPPTAPSNEPRHPTGRMPTRPPTLQHSAPPPAPTKTLGTRLRELPTAALVAIGAVLGIAVVAPVVILSRREAPAPVPRSPSVRVENQLVRDEEPKPAKVTRRPVVDTAPEVEEPERLSGCGQPVESGTRREGQTFGLQSRTWLTHVPKTYDQDTPHPLVILFHDRTRSPRKALNDTHFNDLADERGLVVVALKGENYTDPWSPADDLEYVQGVIGRTSRDLCIDRSRIYAIGHNKGAWAVEELACLMPFSGIATTAYRGTGKLSCAYKPPVPHIHLVGRDNRYMPVDGGRTCEGLSAVPLEEKENAWYRGNRCSGDRTTYKELKSGVCTTKTCSGASFVSCVVEGGRDWPNSSSRDLQLPGCSIKPGSFPFAETIWDFFEKHGVALDVPE